MEKMWKHIDRTWNGPKRNPIIGKRALNSHETEAYCSYCLGGIVYRSSGYTSWFNSDDNTISSGYAKLVEQCPHCGELNDPSERVYLHAVNHKTDEPIEDYYRTTEHFFRKNDFDECMAEYKKEGKLLFRIQYGG